MAEDHLNKYLTYRELELVKEMFDNRLSAFESKHKSEIENIYHKIEDMIKLICQRLDHVEVQINQHKAVFTLQFEQQNKELSEIITDINCQKKKLEGITSSFFWTYFVRILVTLSTAGIFAILTMVSKEL